MGLLSSVVGGIFGSSSAKSAQKFNAQEAEKNREFAREVYQNRYQWQAEDMRQAGLNPILSASSGMSGVSTPGNAQSTESAAGDAAALENSYTASKIADDNRKLIEANIDKVESETDLNKQQAAAGYWDTMAQKLGADAERARSMADYYQGRKEYYEGQLKINAADQKARQGLYEAESGLARAKKEAQETTNLQLKAEVGYLLDPKHQHLIAQLVRNRAAGTSYGKAYNDALSAATEVAGISRYTRDNSIYGGTTSR